MGSPAPYSFVPHPGQRHQRRRQPSPDPGAGLIREITSVEQVVLMPQLPTPTSPQQQQLVLRPHQNQVITTATSDVDAAMARAMLAVISNSDRPDYQARRRDFEPYDGAAPAKTGAAAQVRQGQGMIERAPLSDVPRELITGGSPPAGSGRQLSSSSSSQMNHVMSERKRREMLNESFDALRATLPPGLTKRDKASVLAGAMDVVKSLRAEISELEGKNRSIMEARLPPLQPPPADGTTGAGREERALLDRTDDDPAAAGDQILVRVVKIDHDRDPGAGRRTSTSSAGGLQRIQLRVAAPVPESGDVVDLVVHVLECLEKAIGGGVIKLESLEAGVDHGRQIMNPIGRAVVTMQIKMDDWDEDSFERSIARAVQEATTSSPPQETAAPP